MESREAVPRLRKSRTNMKVHVYWVRVTMEGQDHYLPIREGNYFFGTTYMAGQNNVLAIEKKDYS